MDTPIADFVERYARSGAVRLHMPGHKGKPILGCEPWDITEIHGADALYEAEGIIAQSERNTSALFGSGRTVYSTEGSSQCIKAMLYLALTCRPAGTAPVILAARNVHRSFVHAAALLDFEPVWLWPEDSRSLCGAGSPACAAGGGLPDQSGLSGGNGGYLCPVGGLPPARHHPGGGQRPRGLPSLSPSIPPSAGSGGGSVL